MAPQHGPLQPGGLALEFELRGLVLRRQGGQPERHRLEGLRLTQGSHHAVHHLGQDTMYLPGPPAAPGARRRWRWIAPGGRRAGRPASTGGKRRSQATRWKPALAGRGQAADDVALLVGDGEEDLRVLLPVLGAQHVPAREDDEPPSFSSFFSAS